MMWCCKSNEAVIEPRSIPNIPQKHSISSGTEHATNGDTDNESHTTAENMNYAGFFVEKNMEGKDQVPDAAPKITISYEEDAITTCFSEKTPQPKHESKSEVKTSSFTFEEDSINACFSDKTPLPYAPSKTSLGSKKPLEPVPEEPIISFEEDGITTCYSEQSPVGKDTTKTENQDHVDTIDAANTPNPGCFDILKHGVLGCGYV